VHGVLYQHEGQLRAPRPAPVPGPRPVPAQKERFLRNRKRLILALEGVLILTILLAWLLSPGIRESKSLAVLFFYSFPSEFLMGLLPHEPVLIYFGAFYPASVVALVSVVSTVMAEAMNYSFCSFFYEMPALQAVSKKKLVRKTIELFDRAPFAAILFAGFTPAPFFPVRFLVVMAEYPRWKYLVGVFVSRAPRFFLLAMFGALVPIPGALLTLLFVGIFVAVNLPAIVQLLAGGRRTPRVPKPKPGARSRAHAEAPGAPLTAPVAEAPRRIAD
jgi:membrane protein YqaA with SNARE-associated domain